MPEEFACPSCHRLISISILARSRDRDVACPECQHLFIVRENTGITAREPLPLSSAPPDDVQSGPPPRLESGYDDDIRDGDIDIRDLRETGGVFRSASGLARTVKILLRMNILIGLAIIGSTYLQYEMANLLIARQPVRFEEIVSTSQRQFALSVIHLLFAIVTAIFFMTWFYHVHANLKPLGASGLTYTSGWAIGCWFVPFLNLVRPQQIAQEIWRHSDPAGVANRDVELPGNFVLIRWWWAMWIVSNIVSNIASQFLFSVKSPEELKPVSVAQIFAEMLTICAAWLALRVVASIDSRQTARAEAMGIG